MPTQALDLMDAEHEFANWQEPNSRFLRTEDFTIERIEQTVFDRYFPDWLTREQPNPVPIDLVREEQDLRTLIRDSEYIFKIRKNWDSEGSPGYSKRTWRRAIEFLCKQVSYAHLELNSPLTLPSIDPADEGSIDLHWTNDGKRLLVNIPAISSKPVTYYGEDELGDNTISGRTTTKNARADLVLWLMRRQ